MSDTQPIIHPQDEPATYAIRVKGHLPDRWGEWFGDVTVRWEEDGVTRLTCRATDQAALYGLLRRIRDLGLPLVSVNPVQPGPADVADDES
jgi:hypothetical protein